MAELGAAASGVGLISLGLQCCKGLTAYYSSYRASHEQIGAIHEEIEILKTLFEKLERVLSRNTADPAQESHVQQVNMINNLCQGRLQKLQCVLEKCQRIALPNNLSARLQKIKSQALFPFKEQTLLTLHENVQSLRGDLQFALQVFQTDMEMEHKESFASLTTVSRNIEVTSQNTRSEIQAIAAPVRRMNKNFDLLLQQGENTTTRLSEIQVQMHQYREIANNLCRTISDQYLPLLQKDSASSHSLEHDLITALGEFGTERELLNHEIKSFNQRRKNEAEELATRVDVLNENIMKLQLCAISRPSLLKSANQEKDRLADSVSKASEPMISTGQSQLPILRRRRRKCNCTARYENSSCSEALQISHYGQLFGHKWMLRSGTTSTGSHGRTCPMHSSSPTLTTAQFFIGICGELLNRTAEVSISISRGAGGFSISPKIHCLRVVEYDCEAFRLARIDEDDLYSIINAKDWESFLDQKTRDIDRLFREGQASPYDVDLDGNTLLHMVGKKLDDGHVFNLVHRTGLSYELILRSLIAFCESLHDLGVPLNWASNNFEEDRLFVHPFIVDPPSQLDPDILSHLLNRLCEIGLELTPSSLTTSYGFDPAYTHYYQVIPANAFPKCHDLLDGLCCNEIHDAIVHQSAPHLQATLERSYNSIDEPNEFGHTPLHLASKWPYGLSLLLSYGADFEKKERSGQKPIEFAMLHGCTEAVQLLLEAGCSFELDRDVYGAAEQNVFTYAVRLLRIPASRLLNPTLRNDYFEIVKVIIEELKFRRQSLMSEMAKDPLIRQSKLLSSPSDQILDSATFEIESSLRSRNKTWPRSWSNLLGMHTVYHCPFLTVKVANELWSVGFQEIDVPDVDDQTPLMNLQHESWRYAPSKISNTIEFAFWLYQKGASLHRPHHATLQLGSRNTEIGVQNFERRAIHFVAGAFRVLVVREAAFYSYRNRQHFTEKHAKSGTIPKYDLPAKLRPLMGGLSLDCRQFFHKIMLDFSPDGCLCACSEHGCLPVTFFLKSEEILSFQFWFPVEEEDVQKKLISVWSIRWLFDNVPPQQFPEAVNREIVRLKTFEKLGLRHTCCFHHRSFKTIDPEEADELRDEDRQGIQLLESLLLEFEDKLGDEDVKSFLSGYWAMRMEEVLAARDNEPVDKAGMRKAGVIVHNKDESSDTDGSVD